MTVTDAETANDAGTADGGVDYGDDVGEFGFEDTFLWGLS